MTYTSSEETKATRIATLINDLGMNQKQLGLLLWNMSASQISRLINAKKFDSKFDDITQYAIELLEEIKSLGLMPISPKAKYPNIILAVAELLSLKKRYQYSLDEFKGDFAEAFNAETGELDWSNDGDVTYLNNVVSITESELSVQ